MRVLSGVLRLPPDATACSNGRRFGRIGESSARKAVALISHRCLRLRRLARPGMLGPVAGAFGAVETGFLVIRRLTFPDRR